MQGHELTTASAAFLVFVFAWTSDNYGLSTIRSSQE